MREGEDDFLSEGQLYISGIDVVFLSWLDRQCHPLLLGKRSSQLLLFEVTKYVNPLIFKSSSRNCRLELLDF